MRMRHAALLAVLMFTFGACEIPFAPKWNVDLFFPVKYPDVQLTQYAGPGGVIPPVNVTFTAPADSDDVSDATREIFDKDIDSLKAEVVFANTTNIAGNLDISIAANRAFLFSTNAAQAVTVSIPIRVTSGDTTRVQVNTSLFKSAQRLYTQTRGTMRSNTGAILVVGATDKLSLAVDLTASIKVSKEKSN
jgi:hypothetical protein